MERDVEKGWRVLPPPLRRMEPSEFPHTVLSAIVACWKGQANMDQHSLGHGACMSYQPKQSIIV